MNNNLELNGNVDAGYYGHQVLKLTSLIYLKEAVEKQEYENCAALIREAKGYGAQQSEINALLAEAFGPGYEAKTNNRGRTRF